MGSEVDLEQFRQSLLEWFAAYRRDLPWRRTSDPYAVWVSEIMLQQTRVTAVIPYYERFLRRFPDYHSLAEAAEPDLLTHWAGLGYYHRARNMQKAARAIREYGSFPANHADILLLPGIGDYTAAAVASIGFGLPHAVVDGNVFRVLSRIYGDVTSIASGNARKHFTHLAEKLLDRDRPGEFNQAMMELGATVCLPKNPQCLVCPVAEFCRARQNGTQNELPVKIARQKSVEEQRILFWIESDNRLLVWQRPADSRLMPGFWELPERSQLPDVCPDRKLGAFRHSITFHDYRFEVRQAEVPAVLGFCKWIRCEELNHLPVSTILKKAKQTVAQYRKAAATVRVSAASA